MLESGVTPPGWLQWGRDFSVAEIMLHALADLKRRRLQWGRDSSVAEISCIGSRYTAMQAASMGPRLFSRGNWDAIDHKQRTTTASMGPRLSVAENSIDVARKSQRRYCFNGAATLQSRKWQSACGAWTAARGFNGAATLQSRKCTPNAGQCAISWSFNGAATFSRGNRDQRPGRLRGYGRFNGAATLQSRKCSTLVVVTRKMQGLQWGRDSSVAEIWEGAIATFRFGRSFNGAADFQSRKSQDQMPCL